MKQSINCTFLDVKITQFEDFCWAKTVVLGECEKCCCANVYWVSVSDGGPRITSSHVQIIIEGVQSNEL